VAAAATTALLPLDTLQTALQAAEGRMQDLAAGTSRTAAALAQQQALVQARETERDVARQRQLEADAHIRRLQAALRAAAETRDAARAEQDAAELRLAQVQEAQATTATQLRSAQAAEEQARAQVDRLRQEVRERGAAFELALARKRARGAHARAKKALLVKVVQSAVLPHLARVDAVPRHVGAIGRALTLSRTPGPSDRVSGIVPATSGRAPLPPSTATAEGTGSVAASYTSPLLRFRAYRLTPYFRTRSRKSLVSTTYSNKLDPMAVLCKHDLHGACNDARCPYQHRTDYSMAAGELLQSLVAYDVDSVASKEQAALMADALAPASALAGLAPEQQAMLAIHHVNETSIAAGAAARGAQMQLAPPRWRPVAGGVDRAAVILEAASRSTAVSLASQPARHKSTDRATSGVMAASLTARSGGDGADTAIAEADSGRGRYFDTHGTQDDVDFERRLAENPLQVAVWLAYAEHILQGGGHTDSARTTIQDADAAAASPVAGQDAADGDAAEAASVVLAPRHLEPPQDRATYLLSLGLEKNKHSKELWARCVDAVGYRWRRMVSSGRLPSRRAGNLDVGAYTHCLSLPLSPSYPCRTVPGVVC